MSDDSDSRSSPSDGKAPDAFRTISEVAEELGLPQHVLRFWETRFTQIKPMKRGGGRRYYRPQDVELLRGIRHLLYDEGYTIKGVQRLLREQGLRFVAAAAQGTVPMPVAGVPERGARSAPRREDSDETNTEAEAPAPPPPRRVASGGLRLRPAEAEEPEEDEAEDDGPPFEPDDMPPWEREPAPPIASGLSADEIKRLQATLSDLLDCKRLLDQAR